MRYLAALTASLVCFHATAQAAEKSSPIDAYNDRLTGIAQRALDKDIAHGQTVTYTLEKQH
jgi:hypothetical protein